MDNLKQKSEILLKKELGQINTHILFLEKFIKCLNNNMVFTGRDHTGKLRDTLGYKKLTEEEIINQKPLWLKNNTDSLIEHLNLKIKYQKELNLRYKKGIKKACLYLKDIAPNNCMLLEQMIK